MDRITLARRIASAEIDSPEFRSLVQELTDEARYAGRLASSDYLASRDESQRGVGEDILAALKELAFAGVAESRALDDADTEVWAIRFLSEEYLSFRRRIAATAVALTANRQLAPQDIGEAPSNIRICDLAYLFLQTLVNHRRPEDFLASNLRTRDQRIQEMTSSPEFNEWLGGSV